MTTTPRPHDDDFDALLAQRRREAGLPVERLAAGEVDNERKEVRSNAG